jgi:hypothetical protein
VIDHACLRRKEDLAGKSWHDIRGRAAAECPTDRASRPPRRRTPTCARSSRRPPSRPISVEGWIAKSQFLADADPADASLAFRVLEAAHPVLHGAEAPELFRASLFAVVRAVFDGQILQVFADLLAPAIADGVILAVDDVLIAVLSAYAGDGQLDDRCNGCHVLSRTCFSGASSCARRI